MATAKKETLSLEFQIEELKKKIDQKDKDIKLANERMQKENELVEFHKAKVKKYADDIRNMNLQKKGLRMDLLDLKADMANVDRDKYFESAMSVADKNVPKAEPEMSGEGADAPSPDMDKNPQESSPGNNKTETKASDKKSDSVKDESANKKEDEKSQPSDNITPLEKARAEFNKKHPDGFAIQERSKK